jgi:hypothetical protein
MNLSSLLFLSLFSNSDNFSNVETFMISFDLVQNAQIMITNLDNRSLSHLLINNLHICMNDQASDNLQTDLKNFSSSDLVHIFMKNIDLFTYIIIDCYTSDTFYEIMIDSSVFRRFTVDYEQFLVYQKNNKNDLINVIKAETINVQFEIESTLSLKSITIDIPIELMKFHVIKTNTSFLLSLADMNRLKVYFNNVENILFMITKNRSLSIIRRFDHDFLLWKNSYSLHSYIAQSFKFNFCYLIDVELRQLHRRFDHSFITKWHDLLKRSNHDVKKSIIEKLTRFCIFCQKYAKCSERFKFTSKDEINFNYSVIVDIMYIENRLILHVIDNVTRFQAAKWLQNLIAKHTLKKASYLLSRRLSEPLWSHIDWRRQEFRKQRISSICHLNDNHHQDDLRRDALINRHSRKISCWTASRSLNDQRRSDSINQRDYQQRNSASNDRKSNQRYNRFWRLSAHFADFRDIFLYACHELIYIVNNSANDDYWKSDDRNQKFSSWTSDSRRSKHSKRFDNNLDSWSISQFRRTSMTRQLQSTWQMNWMLQIAWYRRRSMQNRLIIWINRFS